MIRASFFALMICTSFAHAQAEDMPYTCLPAADADLIHFSRGDVLLEWRHEGQRVRFLWQTPEGEFLIVVFNYGTLLACLMERTPYDPRLSISG